MWTLSMYGYFGLVVALSDKHCTEHLKDYLLGSLLLMSKGINQSDSMSWKIPWHFSWHGHSRLHSIFGIREGDHQENVGQDEGNGEEKENPWVSIVIGMIRLQWLWDMGSCLMMMMATFRQRQTANLYRKFLLTQRDKIALSRGCFIPSLDQCQHLLSYK